jgi:CheY-like chemotaxis protein
VSEAAEHRVPPFVYVADRERSIADAVAATLNENGYEAIAFSSGEQLVEAATVLKPDLVIAAVSMEGMTGVEAALRICQNIPECRVVLCVARKSAGRSLRQIAQKNGFILLATPVQPDALLQCLNEMASNAAA